MTVELIERVIAGDGTPLRPYDLSRDPAFHDWIYGPRNAQSIKSFNQWLRDHRDSFVRLYHGTAVRHAPTIRVQGLLPATSNRRNSLQPSNGFVSLAVYAKSAFEFGKMAAMNATPTDDGAQVLVYPVETAIRALRADSAQLTNKTHFGDDPSIDASLAASLIHGSRARVCGRIPPESLRWPVRYDISGKKVGEGHDCGMKFSSSADDVGDTEDRESAGVRARSRGPRQ